MVTDEMTDDGKAEMVPAAKRCLVDRPVASQVGQPDMVPCVGCSVALVLGSFDSLIVRNGAMLRGGGARPEQSLVAQSE